MCHGPSTPGGQGRGAGPPPLEGQPRNQRTRTTAPVPAPAQGPASSLWVRRARLCPTSLLRPMAGGWVCAIVCAQVRWHGNSEQEAGRSLIAICQAECQDRDEEKNQHQKKEGLASVCCRLSRSVLPTSTPHRRGSGPRTRAEARLREGTARWRMRARLGPGSCPPGTGGLAPAVRGQRGRWLFVGSHVEMTCVQRGRWHING